MRELKEKELISVDGGLDPVTSFFVGYAASKAMDAYIDWYGDKHKDYKYDADTYEHPWRDL
ncbi:hypothetical protein BX659_111110 [Orenia metallireducens]|uniref:Uncharacterized protein n=1 Tax=Orenia metallireducens TaxID=1413210 RepID=A0A285HBL3_9FIRM|nr:hypothetical protein [Orenia metallireducens]PRX28991.1 hypothetical protein BX659_111110 [Orenia metallireducens]SNY33057.1 hypothetical protein SAMN06265827_116110 [Orenia metallireducens]